jgi:predicted RND superfamily exporter protein
MQLKSLTDNLAAKSTQAKLQLIQAITRSLLALLIVGGAFYLLIAGIEVPKEMWYVIMITIGATYGVDGILSFLKSRNGTPPTNQDKEE